MFSLVAADDAVIVTVDMPYGPFGGGYGSERHLMLRCCARMRQRIHLVRGNSHNPATKQRVMYLLEGRAVDFLFIDGDHTYEGVKSDFEIYAPLVQPGGIVAFHDIIEARGRSDCGVARFWHEIKQQHDCSEIVQDYQQNSFGIGVLRLPGGLVEKNDGAQDSRE